MIFRSSVYEGRYTAMWNSSVVSADARIKKMLGSRSFFRFDTASCIKSIEQYASTVKNILHNLICQYDSFDDKDYVDEYIESTFSTFNADFSKYSRGLERRLNQDSAIAVINTLKQEINSSIANHRQNLMSTVPVRNDDTDIELFPLPLQESWLSSFNSYELTDNWGEDSLALGGADSWGKESMPVRGTDNLATTVTAFDPTEDWANGFVPSEGVNDWGSVWTLDILKDDCGAPSVLGQYDDDIDIDSYFNPSLS